MKHRGGTIWLLCALCAIATIGEAGDARLMRWADVHMETIVFTYEDDLWLVPTAGGDARRITSHPGSERHAKFSPDGSLIAFSSTREGPSRIYVMTAYGTDQRRLLSMPGEQSSPAWSSNGIYTKVLSGS